MCLAALAFGQEGPSYQESDFLTRVQRLTFEGKRAGEGYFSPDGSQMVFQSEAMSLFTCTTPCRAQGLTTMQEERWISTWSPPCWESSSTMKITVRGQKGLLLMASTTMPVAWSLSATMDSGVGLPGEPP